MPEALLRRWPAARWIAALDGPGLRGDLLAGLTTAVMLVPQAMAYAMLAGLPPVMGLYAAVLPLVAYALLGTSPVLAVGPVAMDSLLVAAGVSALATAGSDTYIAMAVLLALLAGGLQVAMGLLRLGFLVNFLSYPVVSGFTSAAALIIGASQLPTLLGMELERSFAFLDVVAGIARHLDTIHPPTAALGLAAVAVMVSLGRLRPGWPAALVTVGLAGAAVALAGLGDRGVALVGAVPGGLPGLGLPDWGRAAAATGGTGPLLASLLPTAGAIALIGYMEGISVASAYARQDRYELGPSRELVALGAANLAAGVSGGYPVAGGFSRTAVNAQAGAKSPLASVTTAAVVALTLVVLTPAFAVLPKAALAAVILVAVGGLVDLREPRRLWRVKRSDLALLLLTFAATLGLGALAGIGTGIVASLLWFVVRTTQPHTAILGRLPGRTEYRNVANYPEAETFPGIAIVRMDAQFYFGNISFLKQKLAGLARRADPPLHTIILDASAMNQLDSSAEAALRDLRQSYAEQGIAMLISRVKMPVKRVMDRSGLAAEIGAANFFLNNEEAVQAALRRDVPESGVAGNVGRDVGGRGEAEWPGGSGDRTPGASAGGERETTDSTERNGTHADSP